MVKYDEALNTLVCLRHDPPLPLLPRDSTDKDGTKQEWLLCVKCYLILPFTTVLKQKLENLKRAYELEKQRVEDEANEHIRLKS